MPLFGSKFSPKKTPIRKSSTNLSDLDDLVQDQRIVSLKLGEQEFLFEDGYWAPESGPSNSSFKSNHKLKKKIQDLQEENNMLQLKYEIILNMLVQTTAENELQQREKERMERNRR